MPTDQSTSGNVECVASNIRAQLDLCNMVNPESTNYGLETLRHLGHIVWNAIPKTTRDSPTLSIFREHIKSWETSNFPYRLRKTYIQHGFCQPGQYLKVLILYILGFFNILAYFFN